MMILAGLLQERVDGQVEGVEVREDRVARVRGGRGVVEQEKRRWERSQGLLLLLLLLRDVELVEEGDREEGVPDGQGELLEDVLIRNVAFSKALARELPFLVRRYERRR